MPRFPERARDFLEFPAKFALAKAGEPAHQCGMEVKVIDLQFQNIPGVIAAFVVEGPDGTILIETGPESTRDNLLAGLSGHGLAPEDLAGVFVTHIHLDHAGAAGWFAARGIPVYVHERGARHLIDPGRLVASAREVYGDRFDALWGAMVPAPAEWVRPLSDGAAVDIAGLRVEAIETPGHAFHHHAFRLGDTIFAGDAAGARLGENAYTSVTSAPPQFDLAHTLASVAKLRSLAPATLYLTHFGAVPDPDAHLAHYAETVETNADFVRQRLAEEFDELSLQVAYEAFQFEQAFRHQLPRDLWDRYEAINGTAMCADGMRLYWEKRIGAET
ncbi:MAG: MBL fold metallo-hydrolase [Verrucomicrobiaceae bacterium]|nr:MBL fold metallo-hydrolase [Verrucomicrobiaceae bacterium]